MSQSDSLRDILYSLADAALEAQRWLDRKSSEELRRFLPVWQAFHATQPELVNAISPPAFRISTCQANVNLECVRDVSREFAIRLAIVNLGYQTKYERSELAKSSLTLEIRQVSLMREESKHV